MRATKPLDKGKWAEGQAHKWLEARSLSEARFAFHRYPDARSAQGALSAQPADFLVGYRGRATHLEVKETAQEHSLPKDKIRQYPKLKLFDWAGFRTFVLIFRSACNDWVYLDRDDLFAHDVVPKSFSLRGKTSYPDEGAALREIFK